MAFPNQVPLFRREDVVKYILFAVQATGAGYHRVERTDELLRSDFKDILNRGGTREKPFRNALPGNCFGEVFAGHRLCLLSTVEGAFHQQRICRQDGLQPG